jgi:hypothetical protein
VKMPNNRDKYLLFLEALDVNVLDSSKRAAGPSELEQREKLLTHALMDLQVLSQLPQAQAAILELYAERGAATAELDPTAPIPTSAVPPLVNRDNVETMLGRFMEPPEAMPLDQHLARALARE